MDWQPIKEAKPGKDYLLYFPPTNNNSKMVRYDCLPVSYPRKPTLFMEIELPPDIGVPNDG